METVAFDATDQNESKGLRLAMRRMENTGLSEATARTGTQ
jgi:hypothetical protein